MGYACLSMFRFFLYLQKKLFTGSEQASFLGGPWPQGTGSNWTSMPTTDCHLVQGISNWFSPPHSWLSLTQKIDDSSIWSHMIPQSVFLASSIYQVASSKWTATLQSVPRHTFGHTVLARAARKPGSEWGGMGSNLNPLQTRLHARWHWGFCSCWLAGNPLHLWDRGYRHKEFFPSRSAKVIEAYMRAIQTVDCKHVSLIQSIASLSIRCI